MIQIFKDTLTRRLYANDASMYEELPEGVCYPASTEDISSLIRLAAEQNFSIVPRAAATSLAGQTTGKGVIADISVRMKNIISVDPDKSEITVQPGVIRDDVNRAVKPFNLLFGPDTSTTNRCMIGGMIGNNSSGLYSVMYGTTRQHVKKLECVLSDGSTAVVRSLRPDELAEKCALENLEGHIYREMISLIRDHKKLIEGSYPHPEIIRRNTGYALDALCKMKPFEENGPDFNLAELLCGSEGTLAFVTSTTLHLVQKKKYKALLIPHFNKLQDALRATVSVVEKKPSAVELVDHNILAATKENPEQNRNRFFVDGDPGFILMIECLADSKDEVLAKAEVIRKSIKGAYACPVLSEPEAIQRAWNLRKAGLGLLMGRVSDQKSPTFVEDTAVRVKDLPEYISEYEGIMEKYDSSSVYYAHASVGELHLRPVLDLKTESGITKMKQMAEEIAELVKKYRGSLSGEHGDGRARANYIGKVLGEEMLPVLEKVKNIWDPGNILNPGKIIFPEPMDNNLRFHPGYKNIDVSTEFQWKRYANSFGEAVEMCNGAGVCRKTHRSGGTMCPSYMATGNEKDTTRGRANVFRQIFNQLQHEAFTSTEIKEALQLCLSCKACKSECPANVDMAAMKAEFLNGWHKQNGKSVQDLFFGYASRFYPLASMMPKLSNSILKSEPCKDILKQWFHVHPKRNLPAFANRPFHKSRHSGYNSDAPKVLLLVDNFINYHDPEIAEAACEVLERIGYNVVTFAPFESGRALISRGMLRDAKQLAKKQIQKLLPYCSAGIPIIGLEPSEILTFRDEYADFFEEKELARSATLLASNVYQFEEFLSSIPPNLLGEACNGFGKKLLVHAHCHFEALADTDAIVKVLSAAGYEPDLLDSGCCGMAGSFGYESQNYEISMNIGGQRLFPAIEKNDDNICAHGFSCRHQIADGTGRKASHTAVILKEALR